MKRLFLSILSILLLCLSGLGQISYESGYAAQAGNPGGLNTEMDYDTIGWTTIMPGGFSVNQWSSPISLPFAFDFYGQTFVSARVSANGILAFTASSSSVPDNNEALPSPALPNYSIAAFWESFAQNPPILSSDEVISKTFGNAPNRQFWIKWSSYQWGPSSFVNVAIVLEESSGKVYIVDQYSNPAAATTISSTVGVQKDSQTAVMAGESIPLAMVGFHYLDNHYYTFTPYQVPPEDLKPSALLSPRGQQCGLGQENISFSIQNKGQQGATSYVAKLFVNGALLQTENEFTNIRAGDTIVHTFSQAVDLSQIGNHEITIVVNSPGDENADNDSLTDSVIHLKEIASFPHQENFESPDHGWSAGGVNSSWAWATPADSIIMGAVSGIKAWVTNPQGNYNAFESSWVESPCYNLSSAPSDTWISFQLWWETEDTWDGASLVASKDDGQTWVQIGSYSPQTWFNQDFIPTLPGGAGQGWNGNTSQGNGSGGWQKVFTRLPQSLIGEDHVRFRIAFSSNSANQYRGVAFDDFTIGTPPNFNLGANRFFCEGDTLALNSNLGTFSWSTGSTQNFQVIQTVNQHPIEDSMLALRIVGPFGLERRDTFLFSVAPALQASVERIDHVNCFGTPTGAISLSVQNGTAPYGFNWNIPNGEQNLVGIVAGTYQVEIFDMNGCEARIENIVVSQNDSLGVLSEIRDIKCFGDSLGTISVEPFGGVGPYSFHWDDGDSSSLRTGLVAGLYELEIRDSLGCSLSQTLAVYEPEPLQVEVLDTIMASCDFAEDGGVSLDITGGTSPYNYFGINDSLEVFARNSFPVGTYEVIVEDSFGCSLAVGEIEIQSLELPASAGFIITIQDSVASIEDTSIGSGSLRYLMGDGTEITTNSDFSYTYKNNGNYTITQILEGPCGTDTAHATIQVEGIDTTSTTSVGTRESAFAFTLYPNPTTGTIHIKGPAYYKNLKVVLINLEGRVVLKEEISGIPLQMKLPEEMRRGIYILQIVGDGISWREKLIYK